MTGQELRARLASFGSAASALADLALDTVRLVPGGRGRTRLGGLPDLPPGTGWPQGRDGPMEFVAQIDLDELGSSCPGGAFPPRGLLSFFADLGDWSQVGSRVLHHALPADAFSRRNAPPGREKPRFLGLLKSREPLKVYREAFMALEPATSLPQAATPAGLSEDRLDEFYRLQDRVNAGHRLLGHPYVVQNPMEPECARLTGVPAADWRLLLQIDTDDRNSDMIWGDDGMLYWWIPAADLPAGRFDRVVLLAQCC